MTQDWNWFFSSLSQSAAAIVGIFGAFIITKIFSNQTSFSEKKFKIKQLLIQARKISDNANSCNIKWYNLHFNHSRFKDFHDFLEEDFKSEEDTSKVTDEILEKFITDNKFSRYSSITDIKKELRHIIEKQFEFNTEERQREEAANRAEAELRNSPLGGLLGITQAMGSANRISDMLNPRYKPLFTTYGDVYDTPWPAVKKEREELEKNYLEAKHHGRLVADLLESTAGNPESPAQISIALILVLFIFFIGVIYPLSFMPAIGAPEISASITTIKSNIFSFKGALLGVISAAFTIIVTIFYKTNTGMKYDPTDLTKLGGLTDAKNYCQYFNFIDESDLIAS